MPKQLQTVKDERRDWLRPGFELIRDILAQAICGLNLKVCEVHYNIAAADYNATLRYRGWFWRKRVCDVTLYEGKLYVDSDYPVFGIELSQCPTEKQIRAIRGHIEDIMFSMKLPVPQSDPFEF
jgi:hypothetical protein